MYWLYPWVNIAGYLLGLNKKKERKRTVSSFNRATNYKLLLEIYANRCSLDNRSLNRPSLESRPESFILHHQANGGGARTTTSIADVFCPERATDAPAFLSRQGQAQIASGRKACK